MNACLERLKNAVPESASSKGGLARIACHLPTDAKSAFLAQRSRVAEAGTGGTLASSNNEANPEIADVESGERASACPAPFSAVCQSLSRRGEVPII